jgi:thiol-disulfide isomerase/thioredoxin
MFKNQFTDFGWIGHLDSVKRSSRIESFKKQIKEYPFSYYLLQGIYDAKEQYSKKEMKDIFSLFTEDVQKSKLGDKIRTYLKNRPDPNEPYPNLYLLDTLNQRQYIFDTTAKLNMIVFWASWCGPCRMEIPLLKKIYHKYQKQGLNLVSISIDDNRDNWEKALNQENMLWPQFLVDKAKIDEVKQQYNFSSIPLVVFIDKSGTEITKLIGFSADNKAKYDSIILRHNK